MRLDKGVTGLIFLGIAIVLSPAELSAARAQEVKSPEYQYFASRFKHANGANNDGDLKDAFEAIRSSVADLQNKGKAVSLGGMLSLVIFEGGAKLAFYNTLDAENSFRGRCGAIAPLWKCPLARYSYQFGLVPVHTSNFRPCKAGAQPYRALFDQLAANAGFVPTDSELSAIQEDFASACAQAITDHVTDRP